MATKADFTPEEWEVLQWAVADTMAYVSLADPGMWDSFKEAGGAARYIADAKANSASLLVRDLAGNLRAGRDKEATANPADMAGEVAERLAEASRLIAEKAADELDAFKEFILGVAQATAEAKKGVGDNEQAAIETIRAALG